MANINIKEMVERDMIEASHKQSIFTRNSMIGYAERIYQSISATTVFSKRAGHMYIDNGVESLVERIRDANNVFLIGNGGSGAACDHMANDLCLAGIRAQSLTNTNNITCIANDFGFSKIFSKQLQWYCREEDLLIAFSCSGKSENILEAVQMAKDSNVRVVTFSGMQLDNPLAAAGDLNFHVPSNSYGVVQIAHEALIHCAIDKIAGIY